MNPSPSSLFHPPPLPPSLSSFLQSTSCSARCCCSGPSTCATWACPACWAARRRRTCRTWPCTASRASCRCSSPCPGPCCWFSATSTRCGASTSPWAPRWTATTSWPRGECKTVCNVLGEKKRLSLQAVVLIAGQECQLNALFSLLYFMLYLLKYYLRHLHKNHCTI